MNNFFKELDQRKTDSNEVIDYNRLVNDYFKQDGESNFKNARDY